VEGRRVHKGDPGAVSARPRPIAGQAQAGPGGLCDRRRQVGDPEGDVVNPLSAAVEKPPERTARRQRLNQLDVGCAHRHEGDRHVFPGHGRPVPDGESERRQRDDRLRAEIPDDDREMRETRIGGVHTTAEGR